MSTLSPSVIAFTALPTSPAISSVAISEVKSTRSNSAALSTLTNNAPNTSSVAANADNATLNSGSSSAYLAQSLSQNAEITNDDQIVLANSFAHFAPATTYDTFVGYGIVKYRPSDAGIPSELGGDSQAFAPSVANQAYNATESRNQTNLFSSIPQLQVAG